ncbi:hypothetical protein [Duganella violaceipulchra]|uniref:Uncharacterized protein n=1 Tax=Duganella violaceipulchra TaxID=2849652 RepID=A0AA41H3E9_9BURK|nr:hypothetical protein [Duganella violaceicalia]MBV6320103.1 hypothetical protein [Duganella violaceicalia]MCP2010470.1 hypothetical protein [Duganella violaceicalia]
MKHLKLLPLLIAAAFAVPRAHAAEQAQQDTGSHVAGFIGIALLLLGTRRGRSERFKALNEE